MKRCRCSIHYICPQKLSDTIRVKVKGFSPEIIYTIHSKGGGKEHIQVKYNRNILKKKGSSKRANRVKSVRCGRTWREWRNVHVLGA